MTGLVSPAGCVTSGLCHYRPGATAALGPDSGTTSKIVLGRKSCCEDGDPVPISRPGRPEGDASEFPHVKSSPTGPHKTPPNGRHRQCCPGRQGGRVMTAMLTERAQSFGHLFVDRVDKTPKGEAYRYRVGDEWKSLSWAQTKERVFNLAAGLVDLGVAPQQRVAIAATTRIEWILSDLAILCAGAATTTVYPTTAASDVAYILGDSESVVVFAENSDQADKALAAGLPCLKAIVLYDGTHDGADGVQILSLDELAARGRERLAKESDVIDRRIADTGPEDLATLIYTSGTTGRPKGVRLVHDNWTYEGAAVSALGILSPDDVQYLWLPMSHVLGKVLSAVQLELGFSTAV